MAPIAPEDSNTSFTNTPFESNAATRWQQFLSERKIGSAFYYPTRWHCNPLYLSPVHKAGRLPACRACRARSAFAAMYPGICRQEQIAVS